VHLGNLRRRRGFRPQPGAAGTRLGSRRGAAPRSPQIAFLDLAAEAGLDFRNGAFRWGVTPDPAAMSESRIFGGIHITADDFAGRKVGSACGKDAWALAQRYYAGDA
jgi:hypothetical protein